jgi:hypothetical protein
MGDLQPLFMRQSLATMEGEHDAALPTMQPIKPIRNEADVDLALQEIDRCLDAAAGSPERDRLEVLTILVDDYEANYHPICSPD